MTIQKTTDSFGTTLWSVKYFRCGKKCRRTFYSEGEAKAFQNKSSIALENESFSKPKKQRCHKRTIPLW